MSVFTAVDPDTLRRFLADFDLGEALALEGILDGVENTNYFLTTSRGRHVLTLFETLPATALPFYFDLMARVASRGVPAPSPRRRRDGAALGSLCGKPAAIVQCLEGNCVERPEAVHCAEVGALLARMHQAVADFDGTPAVTRGTAWRTDVIDGLAGRIAPGDLGLLREESAFQAGEPLAGLPGGVVHGDVFPDNVLFTGRRLTGVFDFYLADRQAFVYDLAVACLAWCFDAGVHVDTRVRALLGAYRAVRDVTAAEIEAWPLALRAAALRFWLSRQHDACHARPGGLVKVKDPAECRAVWLLARRAPAMLREDWVS